MKPAPFEYHAPDSLDQALDLMHEHGGEAKLLAGGAREEHSGLLNHHSRSNAVSMSLLY